MVTVNETMSSAGPGPFGLRVMPVGDETVMAGGGISTMRLLRVKVSVGELLLPMRRSWTERAAAGIIWERVKVLVVLMVAGSSTPPVSLPSPSVSAAPSMLTYGVPSMLIWNVQESKISNPDEVPAMAVRVARTRTSGGWVRSRDSESMLWSACCGLAFWVRVRLALSVAQRMGLGAMAGAEKRGRAGPASRTVPIMAGVRMETAARQSGSALSVNS